MDWYPLYNSLRIALISTVIIFFAGIAAAYYVARLPRVLKGVLDVLFTLPLRAAAYGGRLSAAAHARTEKSRRRMGAHAF